MKNLFEIDGNQVNCFLISNHYLYLPSLGLANFIKSANLHILYLHEIQLKAKIVKLTGSCYLKEKTLSVL